MLILENGYVQDGLKAVVYLIPFFYLIARKKRLGLKYFWLFFTGLGLLVFGNLLDFIDEFEFLRKTDIIERYGLIQDFFEDIIGFTLGFGVFVLGVFLEFVHAKKKEEKHAVRS